MTFEIFITLFLVFLNGFFVAAEFAIVKVRSTQISSLKGVPRNVAVSAKKVTSNLDGYLAATQLGITLASLGLGWVGEDVTTKIILNVFAALELNITPAIAHKVAVPVAFAFITILHIVFGELAPKSIAIRKAASTTLIIAVPLRIFYFVFRPFIWMLNGFANLILRMVGIPPIKEQEIHSEEELKLIISESEEGGAIEETERELIHNVFDFDDRRVRQILVHRKSIVALDINKPFDELVKQAIEDGYSRYPVYKNSIDEDIIGIIYTKDLMRRMYMDKIQSLNDIIRPVIYVPENMKIKDLLKIFQNKRLQIAIVTNEYGGTSGIVTMEDILEELVGEIQDEYDLELPIVEKATDGSYIVNAHKYISDINRHLLHSLPESDKYDTLSGLISYDSNDIPSEGDILIISGYEITILNVINSSVAKVKMKWMEDEQE